MAGKHEGHCGAHGDEGQIFAAEKLHGKHEGSKGGIGHGAENAHQPNRRPNRRGKAQQGSDKAAQGGAHKEGGHDFPALEAGAQGDGGEKNLQQEHFGPGMAFQSGENGVHAAAVIFPGAKNQGKQNHGAAAQGDAEEIMGDPFAQPLGGDMHGMAEKNGHCGAGNAQRSRLKQGNAIHLLQPGGQEESILGRAQGLGGELGGQGGNQAGKQRPVIDLAHFDDLQHEDRGGQGRSKQGGKEGRHAAKLENAPVIPLLLVAEEMAHGSADAAAQLQGRAFPAGRAAQEMGKGGGKENGWGHQKGHLALAAHGGNDFIRAQGKGQLQKPVKPGNEQAAQGQKIEQEIMMLP